VTEDPRYLLGLAGNWGA